MEPYGLTAAFHLASVASHWGPRKGNDFVHKMRMFLTVLDFFFLFFAVAVLGIEARVSHT